MKRRVTVSRRHLLCGGMAAFAAAQLGAMPAIAADPAVRYLERLRGPLMRAARASSRPAFQRLVFRHADLRGISNYTLGNYRAKLPGSLGSAYRRGVGKFLARYFAGEAKRYRVVKADIDSRSTRDGNAYLVGTRLTLSSGQVYNVQWRLIRSGSRFKINDIRVLGFWLTWFQRQLFVNYIENKGGKVTALVRALGG